MKQSRKSSSTLPRDIVGVASGFDGRRDDIKLLSRRTHAKVLDRPREMTSALPPLLHVKLAPAVPTIVYDIYWRFAVERQAVFFRRLKGAPAPWSDDPILRRYKFTNAYRASDRVSQYLLREVLYKGDQSPRELFFRTLLFKTFNRIETWELFIDAFGEIRHDSYQFRDYDQLLTRALDAGRKVYSAAYIMPTGGRSFREARKHRTHLHLIERMMKDRVPDRVAGMRSMRQVFELLRSYPTIGDFLAYQYTTDLNYSGLTNFSETEFVVAGPGAREGLRKCFASMGGLTDADMIRYVADRQDEEFSRLGLSFQSLWGRPLQFIDCQNLFCEVDKYSRVSHPEILGKAGRSRIKQQFSPAKRAISYWYPPKWGINDRIAADQHVPRDYHARELFSSIDKLTCKRVKLNEVEEPTCT